MNRLGLPVIGAVAVFAMAAISASSASAKKPVLELKDEGVPVAAGGEVGVELETPEFSHCKWTQRAHISLNGAKQVRFVVEPLREEKQCPRTEGSFAYSDVSGGVKAFAMSIAGSATLKGSPLQLMYGALVGPGNECTYEFRKFSGSFPIPGHAVIEGSAVGKLNPRQSFNPHPEVEPPCEQSDTERFTVTLRGHSNQLLETALAG